MIDGTSFDVDAMSGQRIRRPVYSVIDPMNELKINNKLLINKVYEILIDILSNLFEELLFSKKQDSKAAFEKLFFLKLSQRYTARYSKKSHRVTLLDNVWQCDAELLCINKGKAPNIFSQISIK